MSQSGFTSFTVVVNDWLRFEKMAGGAEVGETVRGRTGRSVGRLKWTSEMNRDLLEYKREAQMLVASDDPPRNTDGRKKGNLKVMQES